MSRRVWAGAARHVLGRDLNCSELGEPCMCSAYLMSTISITFRGSSLRVLAAGLAGNYGGAAPPETVLTGDYEIVRTRVSARSEPQVPVPVPAGLCADSSNNRRPHAAWMALLSRSACGHPGAGMDAVLMCATRGCCGCSHLSGSGWSRFRRFQVRPKDQPVLLWHTRGIREIPARVHAGGARQPMGGIR
jgi:hypothetical protein